MLSGIPTPSPRVCAVAGCARAPVSPLHALCDAHEREITAGAFGPHKPPVRC